MLSLELMGEVHIGENMDGVKNHGKSSLLTVAREEDQSLSPETFQHRGQEESSKETEKGAEVGGKPGGCGAQ